MGHFPEKIRLLTSAATISKHVLRKNITRPVPETLAPKGAGGLDSGSGRAQRATAVILLTGSNLLGLIRVSPAHLFHNLDMPALATLNSKNRNQFVLSPCIIHYFGILAIRANSCAAVSNLTFAPNRESPVGQRLAERGSVTGL